MLRAVRDGKKAPVTCPSCDCRLNVFELEPNLVFANHYISEYHTNRDAAQHLCPDIGKVWNLESKKVSHLLD